ncbi:3-ketosteroid-9-alpha-monooxygenase, ferredoxin reductase component [Paraburkholderia domus]|jgi:Flavodoxin reductases (ferredoxin-NADPH reductases) family 1|uniref:3-ketosteroid-9-alpha-monooxygenase, ferredoxin reductase component n=1 Tax=Paraburkholderia domus TaxID=2793075 RepID=A0A9N8QXQ6_9BURK|nr:ferredoxin--NADP reductase [Paraburkholderia domus]MBK5048776.1 ferredoxin--NADP reductase [Burkholderia sp. R-70006]MBK5061514.1 ferredoxin--NADP reductase [Burkholderia sp. R-70199]MBK5086556.1 ferredoxin--NADP reductase [Burkholderia sp. R-69927]MBK5120165.1 ferredoxin--NADP reductase [Burkholderia sp. R-69980]MBK5165607.1 ferredoxin--NADP reductase [Burkholderia sp. R-70211]MBK5180118.1 ferredoxin--NADP reductase [Burkholderia sp. R-69749]
MADSRFHRLKVADVIAESADARSFVFDLPQALHDAFSYRPGQFLTLKVPCADATVQRCYSLSSAPGIDRAPKITVKRVRDGRVSNWMCDSIQPGDELDVMAPAGVFTPRSLDGDLLLFAGGSGITPVLSILKSALVNGRGMLTLIYANRDAQSVIFSEELRQLGQRHAGRLRVIHWLDSMQGIPQQRHLEELARPWSMQECFICGPALFMENALAAMLALGLPRAKVHVERFASLPDLPAKAGVAGATGMPAARVAPVAPELPDTHSGSEPPQTASVANAAIETVLDGNTFTFNCETGETLLDAMLRADVPAPNSCRSGLCGACMCRVEAGSVNLNANHVLDAADLTDGWTLACSATPASATLRVVFPD